MQWPILVCFILLVTGCSQAQETDSRPTYLSSSDKSVPKRLTTHDFQPLANFYDAGMDEALQQEISATGSWKDLIDHKKLAVGIVDLSDPEHPRYAAINGREMMYAASLPKIAVLLALEDAFEKGEIKETSEIRRDKRLMISKSNNQATTRLIDLLGFDKIEAVLTSDRYKLYQKDAGGGLWVGKRYAAGGATNREPLKNLSHAATVEQVARFYYLMAYGKLVSPERSRDMMATMIDPELHHKMVNTLDKAAPKAKLFRKSGSWQNWHADSVLVWDGEKKYVLVALVNDPDGEQIIRDLVLPLQRVLKAKTHVE